MLSSSSSDQTVGRPEAVPLWEKADTVLWAFTSQGIVLHNFVRGLFIELDGPAHIVWSYLDGMHTPDEIAEALRATPEYARAPKARRSRVVRQLMADLADGGFIRSVP